MPLRRNGNNNNLGGCLWAHPLSTFANSRLWALKMTSAQVDLQEPLIVTCIIHPMVPAARQQDHKDLCKVIKKHQEQHYHNHHLKDHTGDSMFGLWANRTFNSLREWWRIREIGITMLWKQMMTRRLPHPRLIWYWQGMQDGSFKSFGLQAVYIYPCDFWKDFVHNNWILELLLSLLYYILLESVLYVIH